MCIKIVSMIRKYHNHTQQANPPHREEEPQNFYNNNTSVRQCKVTSFIFLFERIAKPEQTQSMHNKTNTNTELPQTMGTTYIQQQINNNRSTALERKAT